MLRALTHSGLYRRAALPLLRGFASGGGVPSASSTPQDLFSVVTREIRYEKEDNSSDKQLAEMREALAADWKVVSPVGSAQVTLTSKNVRLDLDITPVEVDNSDDMQEGAEGEEEEGGSEGYRMMVSIDGGKGKTMRFACTIADGLTIHQAQLFDTDKLPNIYTSLSNESSPHYMGPIFEELDSALQNAFYEYLAEKGVNDDLCDRLADFCAAKEQTEYVNYLEEVAKFVK